MMTYEEFCKVIDEPINGQHNHPSQFANLARFVYDMHIENDKLKYDMHKEIERLKESLIHLQEYHGRELYEMKQFIKRNVEPDLRHMW